MASEPDPTNPGNSPAPVPLFPPSSAPVAGDTVARSTDRIVVFRHSNLFYWWPVWVLGFLFALVTWIDHKHLALVPDGTIAAESRQVDIDGKGDLQTRDVLILGKDKKLWTRKLPDGTIEVVQSEILITHYRALGSIYVVVLLLVITITNISIRGLWSVVVIVTLIMLSIIFAAAGWWDDIFFRVNQLSIFMNLGAYLLISVVLSVLWLINFLLFDRQTYMIFTPGQLRVRIEIGGEETVYDVAGMVVQKQRSDLFRHWILGFGSGDLIIKPVGLANPIEFLNVLRVGTVVAKIEQMVKQKVVVPGTDENAPSA